MILTSKQETTQETTQKTTQEKIIDLIKKNPNIIQVEMAKALDLTRDGISYNIKALKENGVIERIRLYKKWNMENINYNLVSVYPWENVIEELDELNNR